MRQIIVDTETTGLEAAQGHRIIEIGCVEVISRRATGRTFHRYLRPDRDVDPGALQVHGITNEFLLGQPRFAEIAAELIEFIAGAELIIHNAPFDVAFLDAEFKRLPASNHCVAGFCQVLDTLGLARKMHPGQRNSLDALCKRYSVDNSHREFHGALLDARILLDVYLAMTGGQSALVLGDEPDVAMTAMVAQQRAVRPAGELRVIRASQSELELHERALAALDKMSGGKTLWRSKVA
ncbi:MAG: DNA polymerase III subunit epsilon [Candidatus Obscuribacterales bacterium]|nr:DNA polymerase III subunit epsilon [Steroidobacteraceae bacterium]